MMRSVVEAFEKFASASWRTMASNEGAIDKIYSPYSAFVATALTTLLSKGSTRAELLHALQFDAEIDNDVLADQLSAFVKEAERFQDGPAAEYDPAFDRVLARIDKVFDRDSSTLTLDQKVRIMAGACRRLGRDRVLSLAKEEDGDDLWELQTIFLGPYVDVADLVIKSANRLWPNANMELDMNEFAILTERMGLPVTPVAFPQPGVDTINKIVAELTNNLIQNLLSPADVDSDTSCVLTNAVYFKDRWTDEFGTPREAPWTCLNG